MTQNTAKYLSLVKGSCAMSASLYSVPFVTLFKGTCSTALLCKEIRKTSAKKHSSRWILKQQSHNWTCHHSCSQKKKHHSDTQTKKKRTSDGKHASAQKAQKLIGGTSTSSTNTGRFLSGVDDRSQGHCGLRFG